MHPNKTPLVTYMPCSPALHRKQEAGLTNILIDGKRITKRTRQWNEGEASAFSSNVVISGEKPTHARVRPQMGIGQRRASGAENPK